MSLLLFRRHIRQFGSSSSSSSSSSTIPSEMGKSTVLSLYRTILRSINSLPSSESIKKQVYMKEARETFRNNSTLSSPENIEKALELAKSKLSYLKIISPANKRRPKISKYDIEKTSPTYSKVYVMKDGKLVLKDSSNEYNGNPNIARNDSNIDPQNVKRFQSQMARARKIGML